MDVQGIDGSDPSWGGPAVLGRAAKPEFLLLSASGSRRVPALVLWSGPRAGAESRGRAAKSLLAAAL